jgi:hypothetical protein
MIANDQGYTERQKKSDAGSAQLFDRNHSSIQRILAVVAATRLRGCEEQLDAYAKQGFRGS